MNKHFVERMICPYCDHRLDSAFDIEDESARPGIGDIALCVRCGEPSQFSDEMEMIKFNISGLDAETVYDIRRKQLFIAHIHNEAKDG